MGPGEDSQEESGDFDDDSPSKKRSIYIVDKKFQYRFALTWLIVTTVFLLIVFGSFFFTTTILSDQVNTPELKQQLITFLKYTGIFITFVYVFFILYLLLLSHRIAGPAYHLRQSIDRIKNRDIQFSVHLREKDYLKNVADSLNNLLDEMKRRNQQARELRQRLVNFRDRLEEMDLDQEIIQEIDEVLVGLKNIQPHNPDEQEQTTAQKQKE